MKRSILLIISIFYFSVLSSQKVDSLPKFDFPVKHQIRLAGSFGEIRTNHFHTGIDIKSTNGTVGDSLFSIADGFVSRVKVDRSGYGMALYIDHPSGHTSVYAHLDQFNDAIGNYVSKMQKSLESWEIDIYPGSDKLPLKRGEFIGTLGNTGRSYGPHLHFEIRDTKSEKPINPFLFGLKPQDDRPPLVFAVDVFGLDYKNQVIKTLTKYTPKDKNTGVINLGDFNVPAWKAGVGLQVFDLMNGASNYNSIYELKMYVDDTLSYHFKMDTLSFYENKMINAHIAYDLKKEDNRTVTCCYQTPGNKLGFLNLSPSNGKLTVYKDKVVKVKVIVSDIENNATTINFGLKRTEIAASNITFQEYVPVGVDTTVNLLGLSLQFKKNSLSTDLPLTIKTKIDFKNRFVYQISDSKYPLLGYVDVRLPVPAEYKKYGNKLSLAYEDTKGKIQSFGGELKGEYLESSIDEFEDYFIFVDTLAPKIIPGIFYSSSTTATEFTFEMYDIPESNGKASNFQYAVFIDDIWQACPYKSMTNTLTIPLKGIPKGSHHLKIVAKDEKGNINQYDRDFKLN